MIVGNIRNENLTDSSYLSFDYIAFARQFMENV